MGGIGPGLVQPREGVEEPGPPSHRVALEEAAGPDLGHVPIPDRLGISGGLVIRIAENRARYFAKLAGDPTKYPEQIKEGLRPWQPKKLYYRIGFGGTVNAQAGARTTRCNLAVYDTLLQYHAMKTDPYEVEPCLLEAMPEKVAMTPLRVRLSSVANVLSQ